MKDFKNILVTQLNIQYRHFGKKKSLLNYNIFQIMAAKHCFGHYVADVTPTDITSQTFLATKEQTWDPVEM